MDLPGNAFCFDSETFLIQPGELAPIPVCAQWVGAHVNGNPFSRLVHCNPDIDPSFPDIFHNVIMDPTIQIVGHNVPFDLAVIASRWRDFLAPIFRAYQQNRISDTRDRQKLLDMAQGIDKFVTIRGKLEKLQYNLAQVAERNTDILLDKSDPWRMKYGTLYGVPVEEWPEEAKSYALRDSDATYLSYWGQHRADPTGRVLEDQYRQARAGWWIHLMMCWGIKTDPKLVAEYEAETREGLEEDRKTILAAGLLRYAKKGKGGHKETKDTKAAKARLMEAYRVLGEAPPITDTGLTLLGAKRNEDVPIDVAWAFLVENPKYVSTNADTCEASGDDTMEAYARFTSASTLLGRVQRLYKGVDTPIQANFDSLKHTGRTSCSQGDPKGGEIPALWGSQLQNPPRAGSYRRCFIARDGYLFWDSDYSGMELCTWSQVCLWALGFSKMAEALNAGRDPHLMVASNILQRDYDWCEQAKKGFLGPEAQKVVDDARQSGKIVNFGYPGGMGPATLRVQARQQYKVILTDERARWLRDVWRATWPEAAEYFRWVESLKGSREEKYWIVSHFRSNRIRARIPYTVTCNTFFQGLAADAAKAAGFEISREMYTVPESPLYGSRLVNFVHDEFLGEVPVSRASDAALRGDAIMREVAQEWVPDVKIRTEPTLTKRWEKKAQTIWGPNGELLEWSKAA